MQKKMPYLRWFPLENVHLLSVKKLTKYIQQLKKLHKRLTVCQWEKGSSEGSVCNGCLFTRDLPQGKKLILWLLVQPVMDLLFSAKVFENAASFVVMMAAISPVSSYQ